VEYCAGASDIWCGCHAYRFSATTMHPPVSTRRSRIVLARATPVRFSFKPATAAPAPRHAPIMEHRLLRLVCVSSSYSTVTVLSRLKSADERPTMILTGSRSTSQPCFCSFQ
jgi:hypothetical protein